MSLLSSDVKGSLSTMKLSFYIKVWNCSRLTLDSDALWFVTYKRDIKRMTSSIESNTDPLLHCWSRLLYILQCLQLHCFSSHGLFIHTYFNKVHLVCLEGESSVQYVYWYCDSIFRAIFNPILNGFCWSCNFLRSRVKKTKTKQQHIFAARTIRNLDNLLSSIQIK